MAKNNVMAAFRKYEQARDKYEDLRVENEHIGAQEPETIGEHAKEYAHWKLEYKNSRIALIAALRKLTPKSAHPKNKET